MMGKEIPRRLPWKIGMLLISLVTAVALITVGVLFYRHDKAIISARKIEQLRFTAAKTIDDIAAWRRQRLHDAERIGSDPHLLEKVRALLARPSAMALREELQNYLKMIQSDAGYEDIIIVADNGQFVLSATGQEPLNSEEQILDLAQNKSPPDTPFFMDFIPCLTCPENVLDLVLDLKGDEREPFATLILRTDVATSLYPLIASWPIPSVSAEAVLARRDGDDVIILSPHQHQSNPQLGKRLPLTRTELPVVQAALGHTGIFYGRDYRGFEIVADLQAVPETSWVLVVKVNQAEILAEAHEHGWFIAGLTGLSLVMTATLAGFLFAVKQRSFFRSMYLAEQEKRRADVALLESAKRVEKLNRINVLLKAVNQAIIRNRKSEDLFFEACRVVVEEGGFSMAWVGVLDKLTKQVHPVAHFGGTADYFEAIKIFLDQEPSAHGPTATAFLHSETVVVADIAIDQRMGPWQEKALLAGYRSSVALPLIVLGKVMATFNLYSTEPGFFTQEEIRFLDEMAGDLAFALEFMEQEKKRQAAERELRKLIRAIEQSPVSMVITDTKGDIEYVNPKFLRVSGYAMEDVLGQNSSILKSGESSPGEYRVLWQTITAGNEWHGEFHNRRKDGTLYWERAAISPIYNEEGQISNFLAVKEDITHQKLLEERLIQSQKMETVGRLAGGVAHDFNNMLGVILGSVDLAMDQIQPDDPLVFDLTEIRKAAERSAELTRQLLAFARKQIISPRILNLNRTIESSLTMMRRLLGEDLSLIWKPAPGLWPIKIDPSQVDQILANVTVNSRDALSHGGVLEVETANVVLGESDCKDNPESRPGEYVLVTISDNGEGMDQATLDRVFEPFFTTKGLGLGTGLGLATIFGIVQQNMGWIVTSSKQGVGSTFRIYLPRAEVVELAKKEVVLEDDNQRQLQGTETILLVEDEDAILELVKRILSRNGYTVCAASNPNQAVELAATHSGHLDLIITDVVMPEMSGNELAVQLSRSRPETKILFMSGHAAAVIARHQVSENDIGFIRKPFTKTDLLSRVRQILDS